MNTPASKRFGGENYEFHATYATRTQAEYWAAELRSRGFRARITFQHGVGGYVVWRALRTAGKA